MTDSPEIERLRRLKKRQASRRRRAAIASGQYLPPLVDPARARKHIGDLTAYGLSRNAIGHLAGLHPNLVEQIVTPGHKAYRTKITRETEAAILSARFDLDRLRPKHHVHSAGTQRRLRALARIGYGLHELSPLLGVAFTQVSQYANNRSGFVFADTARRVRDVYLSLYLTLGPSQRAVEAATRAGWPPPWAWDDETIDDPATKPDLACLRPPSGQRRSEDTLEEVQWILHHEDAKATIDQVAARLGVTKDAISRALKRVEEARTTAYRARTLGAVEGPLTWDQDLELAQDLVEVWAVRERFYANTEAAGRAVTVRTAS